MLLPPSKLNQLSVIDLIIISDRSEEEESRRCCRLLHWTLCFSTEHEMQWNSVCHLDVLVIWVYLLQNWDLFFLIRWQTKLRNCTGACKILCKLKTAKNIQSNRSQWPRGLRRRSTNAGCWYCGFEFRRSHGCFSVVSALCCQVKVSATSWSLVKRSRTD
jgi:hypothetical protein